MSGKRDAVTETFTAQLRQCPSCTTALVCCDGKIQGAVTFWSDDGQPCMTPHQDDCDLRGKRLKADA